MLSATVNCKLPNIIVTMFVGHQQPLQWHVHSWLNCFPVLIACNSNYYGCNWYDMSNCLLEFHCGRYECVVVIKICKLNLCLQCFAECWRMDIGVGTKWKVGRLTYMASAVARAYNGGLGAEPPAGSRGRAPGQGGFAPLKLKAFCFLTSNGVAKACCISVFCTRNHIFSTGKLSYRKDDRAMHPRAYRL